MTKPTKIIARTSQIRAAAFVSQIMRPDFAGGYEWFDVANGTGETAEEAEMDLAMKIAGDDWETVSITRI